ncbi:SGNH/GDSL hydrolase family protein [Thiomonas delicata]|uniref:Putative lipase / esterase protein n=1 Tax=Thiomonas delicata TaxID=364030 RepID=A0A238CZN9_THIDL|nr:SGNH/GDSL hydrolase family protein [Thiomonas delicata]SBP86461.1 putative lipase / esterase protein [Thiomonas delicata]
MRYIHGSALALASAVLLAGCGGGGNPSAPTLATVSSVNAQSTAPTAPPSGGFKAVVSFGDSLSDIGSYTLAAYSVYGNPASPQYNSNIPTWSPPTPYAGGGQFTVNGASTGNWIGDLSSALQLPITPNVIGYAGNYFNPSTAPAPSTSPVYCPFGVQSNCFGFAQGGSMVSNPNGIGHSGGAMTIPVTQQVQNYLTQFTTFNSGQLVTVLAGNNDIFTALGTVSAQLAQGVPQATAVAQAQAAVGLAADQLAGVVQSILAKGGKYVLVYTLPDSSLTPFGRGLPYTGATPPAAPPAGYVCNNLDPSQPCYLLSNLVQLFNQRLLNDLQGQPVKVLDGYSLLNQEMANPAQFGFTNVTTPWCDPATTSSLLCNVNTPFAAAGASTANLGSWLFADSVHPTPAGYQVIANATLQAMKGFGWAQ